MSLMTGSECIVLDFRNVKNSKIGYRIRKIRENKDYSQENMAAELNITGSAYAKIERGETDPSANRLIQIAQILEVDVTEFFKENKAEESNTLQYGFATKGDIEELNKGLAELKRQNERLQEQMNTIKRRLGSKTK